MSARVVLTLVAIAFVGYQAFRFQARGTKISNLTDELGTVKVSLNQSRRRETAATHHVDELTADSSTLAGKVGGLELEKATAKADAASYRADATVRQQQVTTVVASMNALQRKLAADRPTGGIGPIRTTVGDSDLNGDVATLKGKLRISDSTVTYLTVENGVLRAENRSLTDEVSDLERTLNRSRNADANRVESAVNQRHFLNINLKRDVKAAVNDIRAGRTN